MKMEVAKVKSLVGLFFEGLMLVFIFVCSYSDFTFQDKITLDAPDASHGTIHHVLFRATLFSETAVHTVVRYSSLTGSFSFQCVDFKNIKQVVGSTLSISPNERNSFYVLLRDNAP